MSSERSKVLAALRTPYNIDKINNVSAIAVGDATADIKEVQGYLKHFGYLRASDKYTEGTLDQTTSTALGAFQVYQHINKTGVLDEKTKAVINLSRCGFPDALDPLAFNVTPQGWNRRNLTYTFGTLPTQGVTAATARAAIKRAFDVWANTGLGLSFVEVANNASPDLFVEWRPAADPDHSMVGNILAHADFPIGYSITTDRLPLPLHFDKDEHAWVDGAVANAFDIQTITIHEIGHLLGMYHSNVRGSIMFPYVNSNSTTHQLHADDIAGITSLYPALVAPPLAPSKFVTLGGIATSDIAVVAKGPGRIILFTLGQNGALHQTFRNAGSWSQAVYGDMGGNFIGSPVAVSTGTEKVDVFTLGPDKAIYHKWYAEGRNWVPDVTAFNKVGGTLACSEGFTALAWRGRVDLFTRGPDNAVYHRSSTDNNWSSTEWENLGGNIVGGISAVSLGPDRIDLFARKADKSVVHKYWTSANGWLPSVTEWESLGGEVREDPVGVTWGLNRVDVIVVGLDGKLYSKWWDGKWNPSQTGAWANQGGGVIGKPSAVGWGGNRLDVYHRGDGGSVWRKSLRGTVWDSTKISDASQVNAELGPVVNPIGAEKPDIFVRGTDKALWSWAQ